MGSILSDIPDNAPQKYDYWKYFPSTQKMVKNVGFCLDREEALEKFKLKIPLTEISDTVSHGRSWKNIPYELMSPRFQKIWDNPKKYRSPNFYRRFALGEINGTITASAQPENSGITHPFEHRRFTVREIARIQSFPDDFEFPYKSISNAYKIIGNAVPPVLGWVIAKSIEKFLLIKEGKINNNLNKILTVIICGTNTNFSDNPIQIINHSNDRRIILSCVSSSLNQQLINQHIRITNFEIEII